MALYKKKLKLPLQQVWETAVVVQVMASATHFAIDSIPREMFTSKSAWRWNEFHINFGRSSHTPCKGLC